jgi:hypothetical protein
MQFAYDFVFLTTLWYTGFYFWFSANMYHRYMFRSTWGWCWKTPCWETQSMQAYNRMAKKVPAVIGLHLYNAKSPVITLGLVSHDPIIWKSVTGFYARWNPDVMSSYLLWWPSYEDDTIKLPTSMQSWLRTTIAQGCLAYWLNTQLCASQ